MSDDKKTPDVLKEIKFDNFETPTDTITITADVQLGDTNTVTVNVPPGGQDRHLDDIWGVHNAIVTGGLGPNDTITVNTADLELGSNGTKQLDLFEDYLDESKYVPIDPWNEQ